MTFLFIGRIVLLYTCGKVALYQLSIRMHQGTEKKS